MILFWVDDCIFYAKDDSHINQIMYSLKESFLLEQEEDVAGFLGLQIKRDIKLGKITLTQTGLIGCILECM